MTRRRVFIAGVDGYLGWTLAQALASKGNVVGGCDIFARRDWVAEVGSQSITPVYPMRKRLAAFRKRYSKPLEFSVLDLTEFVPLRWALETFRPDCVVHLAEMPSAPYSMVSVNHATYTHENNVMGTLNLLYAIREVCPWAHLLKLGSMGEYGTPDIAIPEGEMEIDYRGREAKLPFPRQAGSWYHQTKVHDSNNIAMACRIWGLKSTDIMQGVVYGTRIPEMGNEDERLLTRFDCDAVFGTAINRFCAQAVIGEPLTVYGTGGQRRGFLPLKDSMQCLTLAIENPPETGEYRVFNQFEEVYSIQELAEKVQRVAGKLGIGAELAHIENPRVEAEQHYYNPDHQRLFDLGYMPTRDMDSELETVLKDLIKYFGRIGDMREALTPNVRWNGAKERSRGL